MQRKKKKQNFIFSALIVFLVFSFGCSFSGADMSRAEAAFVKKKQAETEVPKIYPRSSWSNAKYDKRSKKVWPAKYEDPKIIIVHHTATNYKNSTSKQIKKIYKYHSYTRKWGDIGYNYIIGKDGSIFEGRYGGNGVVGGHSYFNGTNYNEGSIGIAILGNYENENLSSAAQSSLEKLIGWLAANNGISIKSSIKFHSKSLDNAVVGHRNVAGTACPGKNIYNLMSEIRISAENLAGVFGSYAYQIPGDGEVYEMTGGKRYSASAKSPIVKISEKQLQLFSLGGAAAVSREYSYPSGTLFLSAGRRALLENGALRLISGNALLNSSYNPSSFVEIADEKWTGYATGTAAGFRSGAFVKDSGGNYFIISGNQKRKIVLSSEELKLIELGSAHEISPSESALYAEGENIASAAAFSEGTLMTKNNKNYYYITADGKKKIVTKNVFRATFSQEMAVKVSIKLLKKYKTGKKLSFQNGAAVKYGKKYYFIENGKRRQFASKNIAASMGYQNFQKAKKSEMSGIGNGEKIE